MDMSLGHSNRKKRYLKRICNVLYYCGLGDFWYEERDIGKMKKTLYNSWAVFINIFLLVFMLNELLAILRTDLTVKEKNDMMQFVFGHPVISAKVLILYLKRQDIRLFLKQFFDKQMDSVHTMNAELDNEAARKALFYCFAFVGTLMVAFVLTIIDAVIAYFVQGIPFRLEVPYYPASYDTGIFVNILRGIIEIHFTLVVLIMINIDCLCLCTLVFLASKFKQVRIYFENLGENFNTRTVESQEFEDNFVIGIRQHEHALWCARNVQKSMGYIYSVQIVESIILLVVSLLRAVSAEHSNPTLLVVGLSATFFMVIITGTYMVDAADVTYEASKIPTAMFHCGWELVPINPGLRSIIVVALQRSQVPIHLTAFGVIRLSYASFILILRSSYSFFALMY